MFGVTLSKGTPLPFEQKELGPDGRPIIGLFYFKLDVQYNSEGVIIYGIRSTMDSNNVEYMISRKCKVKWLDVKELT